MKNSKPEVVILGAGPAGLGAAFQLTRKGLARVTVIEESDRVGGTAGSFELSGIRVDYGSHRLHPACDPEILKDIQTLLGDELLDRPRHGRIRMRQQWIHFPLKPFDLALRMPPGFTMGVANDLIAKLFRGRGKQPETRSFASALEVGLGKTISREFYFPLATKIWGLPPEGLSAMQARRRVSGGSFGKLLQKVFSSLPGIGSTGSGRFFYPSGGFGQISESLLEASQKAGAEFSLGTQIKSIHRENNIVGEIYCEQNNKVIKYRPDYLWSTIPISNLIRCMKPSPAVAVVQASQNLHYRAMILIYLVIEQRRFTEYDAHYFPELNIPITRLSEPKNYSSAKEPLDRTVLCAELPCSVMDPYWRMTDEELGKLALNCLESAGIPVNVPVKKIISQKLLHAYPIYQHDYEVYFNEIDQWLSEIENLLTFGRQGLFVHDNTHHALYMAYAAVKCFNDNDHFNRNQWETFREVFDNHVVED